MFFPIVSHLSEPGPLGGGSAPWAGPRPGLHRSHALVESSVRGKKKPSTPFEHSLPGSARVLASGIRAWTLSVGARGASEPLTHAPCPVAFSSLRCVSDSRCRANESQPGTCPTCCVTASTFPPSSGRRKMIGGGFGDVTQILTSVVAVHLRHDLRNTYCAWCGSTARGSPTVFHNAEHAQLRDQTKPRNHIPARAAEARQQPSRSHVAGHPPLNRKRAFNSIGPQTAQQQNHGALKNQPIRVLPHNSVNEFIIWTAVDQKRPHHKKERKSAAHPSLRSLKRNGHLSEHSERGRLRRTRQREEMLTRTAQCTFPETSRPARTIPSLSTGQHMLLTASCASMWNESAQGTEFHPQTKQWRSNRESSQRDNAG